MLVQRMHRQGRLPNQVHHVPHVAPTPQHNGRRRRSAGGASRRQTLAADAAQRLFGLTGLLADSAQRPSPGRQVERAGLRPPAGQTLADGAEGRSLDQFHRVEPLVSIRPGREDFDQMRVLDLAQGMNLAGKTRFGFGVAGTEQGFQGHLAAQRRLPGAIDHAHAAAPQLTQQLELPQPPRRRRRLDRRLRLLLGLRSRRPLFRLFLRDRQVQHPGHQRPLIPQPLRSIHRPAAVVAQVLDALLAAPRVEEQRFLHFGVVDQQRMQRSQRQACRAARHLQVQLLRAQPPRRFRLGRQLQRLDAPRVLSDQLGALHQPVAGRLLAQLLHIQQTPPGQHVEPAQQFVHAGQQRPAHVIVEIGGALAGGPVTDLAVAVAHQAVEQLADAHRGADAAVAVERLVQAGVQPRGARQIVAHLAQDQVADRRKRSIPRRAENGRESANEFPPVAQGRPSQVLQSLLQLGIVVAQLRVLDDGDGAEEFQGRFPEVIGGLVALQRRLGVVGAAAELGQGQRQATQEIFIAQQNAVHPWISERCGTRESSYRLLVSPS